MILYYWIKQERIVTIKNDDSAYARYLSFMFAVDITRENLIFGTGYNYLASYMLSMGILSSVDSFILTIICNFGVYLSIIIFFILLILLINLYIKVRTFSDVYLLSFIRYFYVYLIIIIFFSSNFNNILLYFFWITPVLFILFYLSLLSKNKNLQIRNTCVH